MVEEGELAVGVDAGEGGQVHEEGLGLCLCLCGWVGGWEVNRVCSLVCVFVGGRKREREGKKEGGWGEMMGVG